MRNQTSNQRGVACALLLGAAGCALAGSSVLVAGCGGSDSKPASSGTLVVPFQLGNNRSCDDAGVSYVVAELGDEKYVQDAPCENGQVRFLNVPAGSYQIKISAFDDEDVEVMDSHDSMDAMVEVEGENRTSEHEPAVTLTSAPAHLLVRWTFGFTTCRGASIDRFTIKAWRGTGDDLLISKTLPCLLEGMGKDQYRDIDDPDRRFTGEQAGEVTVQPIDKEDVNVGPAAVFKYKAPGAGHDVRVSVECDQGACKGSGKPDPND